MYAFQHKNAKEYAGLANFQNNSPLNSTFLLVMKRIEQQQQYYNKRKTKFWSALVVRVL